MCAATLILSLIEVKKLTMALQGAHEIITVMHNKRCLNDGNFRYSVASTSLTKRLRAEIFYWTGILLHWAVGCFGTWRFLSFHSTVKKKTKK